MYEIIGRNREKIILKETLKSNRAEFIAVYGRRRIGKTHLIESFFKNSQQDPILNKKILYFDIAATKGGNTPKLMTRFVKKINKVFSLNKKSKSKNWDEVFEHLEKGIDSCKNDYDKVVLFIDEFPWFQKSNSSQFLDSFNFFWGNYLSKNNKIILVVSGSAVSWLLKNIVRSTDELYNRITVDMRLEPFSVKETYEFLKYRNCKFDRKQILELYMALGGVAEYLMKIDKTISVHHNIQNLFFTKNGAMLKEYKDLTNAHFNNHKFHEKFMKLLSQYPEGRDRESVIEELKFSEGGHFTEVLEDLMETGLVFEKKFYGKETKKSIYAISDPYLNFYYKWAASIKEFDNDHWFKIKNSENFNKWAGRAFENICFINKDLIKSSLGISGLSTRESSWKFIPKKGSKTQGSQIDMIMDRSDNCIQIIECKFYTKLWNMSKEDRENFLRKKDNFITENKINTGRKTILTTLISVFGASEGGNYSDSFNNQLLAENIFFD